MSMINDALRRASNAAPTPPPPLGSIGTPAAPPALPGATISPLIGAPPVLQPAPAPRSRGLPMLLLTLFVFCAFSAIGIYMWERNRRAASQNESTPAKSLVITTEDGEPAKSIRSTAMNPIEKSAAVIVKARENPDVSVVATQAPAATVSPSPARTVASTPDQSQARRAVTARPVVAPAPVQPTVAAAATPSKPVQFPPLRLQSIFYRPSNPSVMINGKTLQVNDEVQGVTVAAIDPASVTLVLSGRTNILTLR